MKMKVVLLLFSLVARSVCAVHPAKDALAELRRSDPVDPVRWFADILNNTTPAPPGVPKVMVIGDSWAAVVAVNGNESFFDRKLVEHDCHVHSISLAIPGSTSGMWVKPLLLDALKVSVAKYRPDFVWMTLVGNDALETMPDCAKGNKTAQQCGDELVATAVPNIFKIVDAIHEAHPAARVTGFGYDTMFGGLGCSLVTHDVFPQCWRKDGGGNRCFNSQFLRIQEGWDWVAGNRSFVDRTSILGATQVAAGDKKASTVPGNRHIDMDRMGPRKYWPDYLGCFHPGISPQNSDDIGAMVVMEEFYKVYWSKQASVCGSAPRAEPDRAAALVAEPCCRSCGNGTLKYWANDTPNHECAETCLSPGNNIKMGEWWILTGGKGQRANSSAPCAAAGFGSYNRTDTIGAGPLRIQLDKYSHPSL